MHQVILCIYREPRNAILKLRGRSGQVYGMTTFNPTRMRHETAPMDLAWVQNTVLPDVRLCPSTLKWEQELLPHDSDAEIARLNGELHEARAHIAMLEAAQAAPAIAPEPSAFDGLPKPDAETDASGTEGPKPMAELRVRELRQLCKDRNIALPHNSTHGALVALLESVPAP